MTTNQTIDGVLVSRELLEVFTGPRNSTPEQMRKAMDELRALLDAPAVQWLAMEVNGKPWVIKEGPNADKWRAMGYELFPVEPVAWDIYWTDNGEFYFTLRNQSGLWKYEQDPDFKVVPLYAEQPAPVAVAHMCDCNQGRLDCNRRCKP